MRLPLRNIVCVLLLLLLLPFVMLVLQLPSLRASTVSDGDAEIIGVYISSTASSGDQESTQSEALNQMDELKRVAWWGIKTSEKVIIDDRFQFNQELCNIPRSIDPYPTFDLKHVQRIAQYCSFKASYC